ncbi:hypothetical protein MPY17_19720 [Rhodococcus opacus]|uniref:hypothetical protein n=1 Tax=Rhodococcus opacus TaxID=37919 RepID=UPI001FF28A2A|nr:hypothetical protein [Rhodococcus opacus]UOT07804.1 hypothetical protein MPY17_19720 [Rhodococcus opacus]
MFTDSVGAEEAAGLVGAVDLESPTSAYAPHPDPSAVRKAAAPRLREGPRAEVTDEKTHLTDPEILELIYITSLYDMHATMCRALRLEFDDRPELVAEVEIPAGVEVRDLSADLSGE